MQVVITNLQTKVPIPQKKISQFCIIARNAVRKQPLPANLSIVFVSPQRMRRLNKKYLGHDYVTDVITFDYGEIIICPQVAAANAKQHKTSTEKELVLYAIHGILHLAGYDDHKPKDIKQMRAKEQEILSSL